MSNPPIVVVHEHQLEGLPLGEGAAVAAFAADRGAVVHVHVGVPVGRPSGAPLRARVVVVPEGRVDELARMVSTAEPSTGDGPGADTPAVSLLVGRTASGLPGSVHAWVSDGLRALSCDVVRVPRINDLFSRSRGLLECDALAERTVGIVGLGSGGSSIAVELAKAGVGRFVLIDPERLELANVARHACGLGDLGRNKVDAVADALRDRNPHVRVAVHALDVNLASDRCRDALAGADVLIGATDENRSRAWVNRRSLETDTVAIFGRAITRAAGGDVLRVRPRRGPCLACVFAAGMMAGAEEVSSARQAASAPAYTTAEERAQMIQPGLAADIAPISNMMVRLALLELSRGTSASITSLDADLVADFYVWANRRERLYASWPAMGYGSRAPSVLRWYGAGVERAADCLECGAVLTIPLQPREGPRRWA